MTVLKLIAVLLGGLLASRATLAQETWLYVSNWPCCIGRSGAHARRAHLFVLLSTRTPVRSGYKGIRDFGRSIMYWGWGSLRP